MATDDTATRDESHDSHDTEIQTPPPRNQGQARQAARRDADADADTQDPDRLAAELERTRVALKKANSEAAERRRRLEELEAEQTKKAEAELSETEKLRKALAAHEAKARDAEALAARATADLQRSRVDHAIERFAAEAGFLYPETVPALIDRDAIEVDEHGKVLGVRDAVNKLAKDKPGLLSAPGRGGTPVRDAPRRGGGATAAQSPHDRVYTPEERIRNEVAANARYSPM